MSTKLVYLKKVVRDWKCVLCYLLLQQLKVHILSPVHISVSTSPLHILEYLQRRNVCVRAHVHTCFTALKKQYSSISESPSSCIHSQREQKFINKSCLFGSHSRQETWPYKRTQTVVILNLNDSWGNKTITIIKIKAQHLPMKQATTEILCLARLRDALLQCPQWPLRRSFVIREKRFQGKAKYPLSTKPSPSS